MAPDQSRYLYVCMYVCMHIMYVCVFINIDWLGARDRCWYMYICRMCIHIYIHEYSFLNVSTHTYIHTYIQYRLITVQVCQHIYMHTYMHAIHLNQCACPHSYMHAYTMSTYIHAYLQLNPCLHTYMRTYTHAYIPWGSDHVPSSSVCARVCMIHTYMRTYREA